MQKFRKITATYLVFFALHVRILPRTANTHCAREIPFVSTPPDNFVITDARSRRPRAGERTRGAVDALQTKIAIGVQNLAPGNYLEQLETNISELPDAAGCDAAFVALIDADGKTFDKIIGTASGFAQCRAETLVGESLEDWPWLCERLGHLKVIEVADTLNGSRIAEAELHRLSDLHIGSILILGFSVHNEIAGFLALANEHAVDSWDANLHLLLKLIGASLASGLERIHDHRILDELQQRNALIAATANDGIWDFDGETKRINLSRRWKTMLGYDVDEEDMLLDWYNLVHPERHGARAVEDARSSRGSSRHFLSPCTA